MKCIKCGTELAENANFCINCGEKIVKDTTAEETMHIENKLDELVNEDDISQTESSSSAEDPLETVKGNVRTYGEKLHTFYKENTKLIVAILLLLLVAKFSHNFIPTIIKLGTIVVAVLLFLGKIKCSKKWLKILCYIVAAIFALSMHPLKLWFDSNNTNKEIVESFSKAITPYDSQSCIGQDKDTLQLDFIAAGFYNVTLEAVEDLDDSEVEKCGTVKSVSINGIVKFDEGTEFDTSSKIVIKYHSYKQISFPLSPADATDMDADAILSVLEAAGFVNIETEVIYDLDPDLTQKDFENKISIKETTSYQKGSRFPLDANIRIITHRPYEKYTLKVIVDFIPNIFFNTYDVSIEIGNHIETLPHGNDKEFEYRLAKGNYIITFKDLESSVSKGTVSINLSGDTEASYKISCHTDRIDVDTVYIENLSAVGENEAMVPSSASDCKYKNYKDIETRFNNAGFTNISTEILYDIYWGWTEKGEVERVSINGKTDFNRGDIFSKDAKVVITYHMGEEDDPNRKIEPTPTPFVEKEEVPSQETVSTQVQETEVPTITSEKTEKPVSYSTNTRSTVKDGNKGVYSYKSIGGIYDIYWIIDFDEGYVYWFTDGNGDGQCDRLKIESGDLNSVLIITYHDGDTEWSNGLHFKYKRQPDHLIMEDHNHFEYDYYTTDLDKALAIRGTKTIIDY